jgi:hypothetical protein
MRTYIVLGMHRSATSFLAKALAEQGVNMGRRLMPANKWNEHGYFENLDFVELNDLILKEAGGSWCNPPPNDEIIKTGEKYKDLIKEVIERNRTEMWGWKDPRTSLTLPAYLPYLSGDIYLICIFRNSVRVAESLRERDGFSMEKGIELAKKYNMRISGHIKRFVKDSGG